MMCDILIASPTATFGQPEITLGILPGAGGTQRLTHLVGKARAMEIVLTGRKVKAEEAERIGLVSRLVQGDGKECVAEAVKVATLIAGYGGIAVQAAKEAVNAGTFRLPLSPIFIFD
jgi:enoyl-CoA hydratase